MEKGNPLRYRPVKKNLSIVTVLQLLCAISQLVELSLVLTRDKTYFTNELTKTTMVVFWFITLFWLMTVLISILGIVTNSYWLIVPNILYCTVLILPAFSVLLILLHNDTRSWSLIYSFMQCLLLLSSVYIETRCFIQMRELLAD